MYYDINGNSISYKDFFKLLKIDKYRDVGKTKFKNDYILSTVFLGVNHSFSPSEDSLIFETMCFNKVGENVYCERYSTLTEAIDGHIKKVVDLEEKGFIVKDNWIRRNEKWNMNI